MARIVMVLVGVALVAGACSSADSGEGGRSESEQELVDEMTSQILQDQDAASPFGATEARCVSETIVDDIGLDGLDAMGITADDAGGFWVAASEDDANRFIDIAMSCVDFRSLLAAEFSAGVSRESAECLANGFPEGFVRATAVAGIRNEDFSLDDDPEMAGEIIGLVAACLSPDEIENLGNG